MAINTPAFNIVREALSNDDDLDEALVAFGQIEKDVERLMQELNGLQEADRQLRQALEEPSVSQFQRR